MRLCFKTLKLIFLLSLTYCSSGQVTLGIVKAMLVELKTKDGMNLFWNVEEVSTDTITLEYETFGQVSIATHQIKSLKHI